MSDPAYGQVAGPGSDLPQPTEPAAGGGVIPESPVAEQTDMDITPSASGHQADSLIADMDRFRRRWESIQVGFVDDPRRTVDEAAELITDVIAELTAGLRRETAALAAKEDQSDQTEEMRQAFTRYRDFFDRLLFARL